MNRSVEMLVFGGVGLGASQARAVELLDYLRSVQPQTVVVAGDLIDLTLLQNKSLPHSHLAVLHHLLDWAQQGVRVYFLPGDLEKRLRRSGAVALGQLHIRNELRLRIDGQFYLMLHGDGISRDLAWRDRLPGEQGPLWVALRRIAHAFGSLRRLFSKERRLEAASELEASFRRAAAHMASRANTSFVLCAHEGKAHIETIHLPDRSITYLSPGSWSEHNTALEYQDKQWQIHTYMADQQSTYSFGFGKSSRAPLQREQRVIPPKQQELLHRLNLSGLSSESTQ